MTDPAYTFKFWGVRGSIPSPGAETARYGGNTSCLSCRLGEDEYLILDCGTGLRAFGNSLAELKPRRPMRFHVFLTHYHFDHLAGLPFFSPLFDPDALMTFNGFPSAGRTTEQILGGLIAPPYFPVPLERAGSQKRFVTADGSPIALSDLSITALPLNHPGGSRAYRLERAARRIVYATDHEHGNLEIDAALIRFSEGADTLIYDAQYLPSEYEARRRGWGHSTWSAGVRLAREAGVGRLVLFHHDPSHTDSQLDAILGAARAEIASVDMAREGMELRL